MSETLTYFGWLCEQLYVTYTEQLEDRDSVVDIVTPYEQDGSVMQSRGKGVGARFSAPIQNDPGVHPGFFFGG